MLESCNGRRSQQGQEERQPLWAGGSSPGAEDWGKLDRLNQFDKDRQIALARLDSKLELKW